MTENNNTVTTKQIWFGILFITLLAFGMIISDLVIKWLNPNSEEIINIEENEINLPPEIKKDSSGDIEKYKSLQLLSESFSPPQDIYDNEEVYQENLINIALIGDFDEVKLKVVGKIDNDKDNFISLNIDGVSGTLGGYRKSVNTLDLEKTTGVFNKKNPINFTLDLKEPIKFSTTKEEFLSTFESTKNIVIWDRIKPSSFSGQGTIAKLMLIPYDQNGKYGNNVSIGEMELLYTCKGGENSCSAKICDKNENYTYGSECLKDSFEAEYGKTSWENYAEFFK